MLSPSDRPQEIKLSKYSISEKVTYFYFDFGVEQKLFLLYKLGKLERLKCLTFSRRYKYVFLICIILKREKGQKKFKIH